MAGRLPFNLPNHSGSNPLQDPQIRAALGLGQVDEALYLQQQRELQRDFHLRQLLFQDQFDHQSRIDSLVAEQRLKQLREQLQDFPELPQHYTQLLLQDRFQRDQGDSSLFARAQLQQHEDFQRRALAQSQDNPHQQASQLQGNHQQHSQKCHVAQQKQPVEQNHSSEAEGQSDDMIWETTNGNANGQTFLRDIAADSLAGNAVKRSEVEKRGFAKPNEPSAVPASSKAKRSRASTDDSGDGDKKKKRKRERAAKKSSEPSSALAELGMAASQAVKQPTSKSPVSTKGTSKPGPKKSPLLPKPVAAKPSAQALLDFASGEMRSSALEPVILSPQPSQKVSPHGTFGDLISAAESSERKDEAASVLTNIKAHAEWSDDDTDERLETERKLAIQRGDNINLPNFSSVLPQLPLEPEATAPPSSPSRKKKRKKKNGLLDDDSIQARSVVKAKVEKKETKEAPGRAKPGDASAVEIPYPIDTWWPTAVSIRKERKINGEPQDEDLVEEEEEEALGPDIPFRTNMPRIKERFAQEVAPGVLEKIPHCKIHRLNMRKRKNPPVPELVHCFQVTEIYPNDMMVCCSHCGTWRHTACGGHYKPFSVRECIDAPFTAICDRCYAEEKILRDYPTAKKRIERQRSEQIRRGLATSAAMRQASFSKHGGTYKWPLGSVSATHIGGHTRSVHHRHDKAEKQWQDMASRLNKVYGYRPKERVKVRTKELERLLVSVEDAEGHTDRHNMMLFLLNDTLKEFPSGFEKRRRNIFDPEEDEASSESQEKAPSNGSDHTATNGGAAVNNDGAASLTEVESATEESTQDVESESHTKTEGNVCARTNCYNKPRFDSLFCSDACGVASLESDLLRTFHYTSDMHPSLLRS